MADEADYETVFKETLADPFKVLAETFEQMRETQRRHELLRSKPEELDAPVREELRSNAVATSMSYGDNGPMPLGDFVAEIEAATSKIAEKGYPIFIEFQHESGYDGDWDVYLRLSFDRPPTKGEVAQRKRDNAEREALRAEVAATADAVERAEFERLKAKFDNEKEPEQ